MVQPPFDLQHFLGDAAKGLCYFMDQLPVVVEVIMGPCPQVGLMSSGRKSAAKTTIITKEESSEVYNSDLSVHVLCLKESDPWRQQEMSF